MTPTIGFPERWTAFNHRHARFVAESYPQMIELSKAVFHRRVSLRDEADDVMFLLGRAAAEDFFEIWVLGGNGYGFGAMKILRTMFEKVATAGYLLHHPDEIKRFRDYGVVQFHKIAKRLKGTKDLRSIITPEAFAEIEKAYEIVKESFAEKKCSKCGRDNPPSWTSLDMYSLATSAGYDLGQLAAVAYAIPNLVIHASAADLSERKLSNGDGTFRFNNDEQEQYVDRALSAGTVLFITNMLIQDKFFQLDMETPIALLFKSIADSYGVLSD